MPTYERIEHLVRAGFYLAKARAERNSSSADYYQYQGTRNLEKYFTREAPSLLLAWAQAEGETSPLYVWREFLIELTREE